MQLQEAFGTRQKYKKPRVGRGGKRGTTSGKGTKGQKSRAGRKIRPAERDYIQRIPKSRGFKNKPHEAKTHVVNLGTIEKRMSGNEVNPQTLIAQGILRKTRDGSRIKILADGALKKALIVSGVLVSESAKKKIEAAGGHIE